MDEITEISPLCLCICPIKREENLLPVQGLNPLTDHPNVRQRPANVMFELLDG